VISFNETMQTLNYPVVTFGQNAPFTDFAATGGLYVFSDFGNLHHLEFFAAAGHARASQEKLILLACHAGESTPRLKNVQGQTVTSGDIFSLEGRNQAPDLADFTTGKRLVTSGDI